jgi:hypothetical protein
MGPPCFSSGVAFCDLLTVRYTGLGHRLNSRRESASIL